MIKKINFILILAATIGHAHAQTASWKQFTSGGYVYRYVTSDPMAARFYTLKNGLTVIMSVNRQEPRVAVRIAVRAGSNNDPQNHTGLAHYLEHLLFKGTEKYGSLDWQKEKPLLQTIDSLYEVYNHLAGTAERKKIYHLIDSVSGIASRYAIANEYDKLMAGMGSQATNAHTWVEETVYEEDIPSGAMDKFLAVQAERFRDPVFRLFHTELEAVYEEKNRGLDNDPSKMSEAMHAAIFPTHHYGTQTTIGTIEHLKNPSLVAIRDFYNKYYVPGNMAIILSGDLDPDEMIKKIDAAFSFMQPKKFPLYHPAPEKPLTAPVIKEIFGPSAENVRIAFRTPAAGTRDALVLDLASSILSNGKAGLLDLDLLKAQKLQGASAGIQQYKDYGMLILNGTPKPGQTLDEVKDLLFAELDKLKKGDFDEALVRAIVANSKLAQLEGLDDNKNRAETITDEFIRSAGKDWDKNVAWLDQQAKVTREEIIAVTKKYTGNGYALLYKRKGEDKNIVKVEKPPITAIETNRNETSAFVKQIGAMQSVQAHPQWLDFEKGFSRLKAAPANLYTVQNKDNDLFHLYFRFDMGTWNNKLLSLATQYLQYIGTAKASAEGISKQFYALAGSFSVNATPEITTVTVSGLGENFEKTLSLFEDLIAHCKPDENALAGLKERIRKARANAKLDKRSIISGMINYARYGPKNPFNAGLTDAELGAVKADDLVNILHGLFQYKHSIVYWGPLAGDALTEKLLRVHHFPAAFLPYPEKSIFKPIAQSSPQTFFTNYDMVQSEIYWVRNGSTFDENKIPSVDVFNQYFGGGMGSIVFQEIRESRALAYSTFASTMVPAKKEDPFYSIAYVGCQADKAAAAMTAMDQLLDTLPLSPGELVLAKASIKKDIESDRITKDGIIFTWLALGLKGIDYDIRKKEYENVDAIGMQDMQAFHARELSHQSFSHCVIASEDKIDMKALEKNGPLKKLTLEEIFGY